MFCPGGGGPSTCSLQQYKVTNRNGLDLTERLAHPQAGPSPVVCRGLVWLLRDSLLGRPGFKLLANSRALLNVHKVGTNYKSKVTLLQIHPDKIHRRRRDLKWLGLCGG